MSADDSDDDTVVSDGSFLANVLSNDGTQGVLKRERQRARSLHRAIRTVQQQIRDAPAPPLRLSMDIDEGVITWLESEGFRVFRRPVSRENHVYWGPNKMPPTARIYEHKIPEDTKEQTRDKKAAMTILSHLNAYAAQCVHEVVSDGWTADRVNAAANTVGKGDVAIRYMIQEARGRGYSIKAVAQSTPCAFSGEQCTCAPPVHEIHFRKVDNTRGAAARRVIG